MQFLHAACYIRVSTDDQTEFSPGAQLRAIKKYCCDRGLELSERHIYRDEGVSARRAETRPGFMRMITDAKRRPRPFDIIIVHKFDRFARNREDSVVYKSVLRKQCGIRVISVTEQMEDDKFSIILESLLEAMAEYYSLNLSDEVKKGMSEKALRGELQTPAPLGYVMTDGMLTPDNKEAAIVKRIYELFAYENMTASNIAEHLNSAGLLTKKGNLFKKRSVSYILNNPVYAGKIRWNSGEGSVIVTKGRHCAIIDEQTYNIASEKMSGEIKRAAGKPSCHPLLGLLKCRRCGGNMYLSGKIFRCGNYLNKKCAYSQGISAEKIMCMIEERAALDCGKRCDLGEIVDTVYYDKQTETIEIRYTI